MKKYFLFATVLFCASFALNAQSIISEKNLPGSFSIVSANKAAAIYVDATDFILVQKAAAFLQSDIEKVTGQKPAIVHTFPSSGNVIVLGTIDKSSQIKSLVSQKKLNPDKIKGQWDAYQMQVIVQPARGIEKALVITGSDKRGTAYGVFELSKQMGVSPWYWWADVPVKKKKEIYFTSTAIKTDAPKVKYRGLFINDEAPALSGWTKEKFGGMNHKFYEHVFELILRLKGNYLWPAMWGNAFNDDDTLNPVLAHEYGIVMGTSHHEPMVRAQQEWKRYGKGKWDYDSNAVVLKDFWKKGIENMRDHESIVTVGMRGDGDMPMTRGTATALLERIVKDQRQILEEVTKKPASETPQLWALYKEVQDYYDKGMRVPDDVTLLLCDDNWGNIRKLPKLTDAKRKGGYGIYYHFDYVGGPRNYKWINTNPIPRVWEQMNLAYEYGVRDIWIVNVGDIKPMEFPLSFWFDYAWNPEKIGANDLQRYTEQWTAAQFGTKHATDIAELISKYSKYNGRRKPELLDANTYSLLNYNEAERVTNDYNNLMAKAEKINNELSAEYRDAFFQLVLHPVKASANLQDMYTNVAWNRYYAEKKNILANKYADRVKQLYKNDSLISVYYNTKVSGGKWSHMMDQTHIGYTYWQQPPVNKMPEVKYVSPDSARVTQAAFITTDTSGKTAVHLIPKGTKGNVFYEKNGYVSVEAMNYTKAVNTNGVTWRVLPDLGKTASAVTPFPVTAAVQSINANAPHLEYDIYVYDTDSLKLLSYFSPTLNFHNSEEGLQYAVSIDNEKPQIFSLNKDENARGVWDRWAANNIILKTSSHYFSKPGKHTIKFWMVNPGVVLQKLVVDLGGVKQSYLGPPETKAN
jgi:hypothetical protein